MNPTADTIKMLRQRAQQLVEAADALAALNSIYAIASWNGHRPKRHLSAAGRRAIQKAQRARWALVRRAKAKKAGR